MCDRDRFDCGWRAIHVLLGLSAGGALHDVVVAFGDVPLFVLLAKSAFAPQEIRLYNVSAPMEDIGLLSRIQTRCSGSSFHDYRILEFKDAGFSKRASKPTPA